MKNFLVLTFAILTVDTWATCSAPISRTNSSANQVLTSTKYNSDLNTVYTKVNDLSGDCITDGTLVGTKLASGTVAKDRLVTGYKDETISAAKTATYTATATDETAQLNAAAGAFTVNLPTAVGISGRMMSFKKIGTDVNPVTIDANSSETIDNLLTATLVNPDDYIRIISNGSNWIVVSKFMKTDIWLYGGSGFGSTNTRIRRFTTVVKNIGTGATLTQSVANGDSVTINEPGAYNILYCDSGPQGGSIGLSVNTTQPTVSPLSITAANLLATVDIPVLNYDTCLFATGAFVNGDVIRAHSDGGQTAASAIAVRFRVTKVSP